MDLLFKRYASPYFFIDGMIQTGRFCEFVVSLWNTEHEEKEESTLWDYFLHKVFEGSFDDFKAGLKVENDHKHMTERTIEATVNETINILNNFNPEKGGE